jgi:simple sugar transport system permease protein
VAVQFLQWASQGPLRDPKGTAPQTATLPDAVMLLKFSPRTDLHSGVFLSLIAAVAVFVYLRMTVGGLRLRIVGENPRVARAAGFDSNAVQLKAMMLSGALCGLAGGVQYVGISGVIDGGFAQNWGFLGIPVALLGGLDPLGVVFSALMFGALFAGTQSLSRSVQGGDLLIFVVQGVAVLAFVGLSAWQRHRKAQREAAGV